MIRMCKLMREWAAARDCFDFFTLPQESMNCAENLDKYGYHPHYLYVVNLLYINYQQHQDYYNHKNYS